jgi:predicted Zn finger-like uncharacterized protein
MKITCESCSAQYDLDDNRIPPSGLTMKCPACLHSFTVKKGAPAAAGLPQPPPPPPASRSEGITLSELSDFAGDDADLPAPVSAREEADLPAPVAPREEVDLPAPRANKPIGKTPLAPPKPPITPPPPKAAPPPPKAAIAPPPPKAPPKPRFSDDDLPAPVSRNEVADLPAPKSGFVQPSWSNDVPDLLAPKGPPPAPVGIGLDAPEADDLLEPVRPLSIDRGAPQAGPPPIDLDHMDVVAPKVETTDLQPVTTDLQPKPEVMDVVPATMDVTPAAKQAMPAAKPAAAEFKPLGEAPAFVDDEEPGSRRRLSRGLLFGGGGLLLVAALGMSLGLFTSSGFFGVNLLSGHHAEGEAKVAAARKLLAEDTLQSYRWSRPTRATRCWWRWRPRRVCAPAGSASVRKSRTPTSCCSRSTPWRRRPACPTCRRRARSRRWWRARRPMRAPSCRRCCRRRRRMRRRSSISAGRR